MKKIYIVLILLVGLSFTLDGQVKSKKSKRRSSKKTEQVQDAAKKSSEEIHQLTQEEIEAMANAPYRRSSLYSFLVSHPHLKMDEEIVTAFMAIETPDKYNNHDLSVKCVTTASKKDDVRKEVDKFLKNNNVAKRLVSKWFMRDKEFGWNSPDLILERGQYDVSATDIEAAAQTKTGIATLGDRGFELIDNTFVIANDITYVDHEKNAQIAKDVLSGVGALFAIVSGQEDNLITSLATVGAVISDMIAGFTVKVTSYLYQLDWSEEIADIYYNEYYIDRPQADSASIVQYLNDPEIAAKIEKYEKDNSTFSLSYVGKYQAKSAKPVLRGLYNPTDVFKKVCARAIDNNVAALQKSYDQFKVKVPLYSTEPLMARIGLKEDVTPNTKYEVLMPIYDQKTGKTEYRKKGVIKPIPGKIWDNRYMASEEDAVGSELNSTSFKVVSGGGFTEGMLIREIGKKKQKVKM